ncbi:MAG TPA: sensor histidine kinase KdpD [Bacteroidales bacterium]|nr:sensor histidine kinase KdpD [Bacteroidales bacterium]
MKDQENIRPDPDELLATLLQDEQESSRGKLHIFFGMCAGVGKTYTMLKVAREERAKGADLVIGYVETHSRKETAELAEGMETIPRKTIGYRGAMLEEMDLDAVLARHPDTALVDELAHTNAPGSRHAKRYQDVLELLGNGIHVYTTLNVQHLESRSETVAQITGVLVRETLPDEIFENADEVELVDLPPGELLQRMNEGKVYTADQSREAVGNFFRKGNLVALREMALRMVAERVDRQLHDYMQRNRIKGPWKSGLSLLVAVDYRPQSMRLLRWAKNLSDSMGATIQAIYVETLDTLNGKEREQLDRNFALAKQLGIRSRIVTNRDVVRAIVDFAQKENITHIIVGKPRIRNIGSMFRLGNFVNRLVRFSGNIDVYILGADRQARDYYRKKVSLPPFTSNLRQYALASLFVVLSSIAFYLFRDYIGYQVVSFGLLFLVSILALFFGTGPILLAAVESSLIWDYFFIPPQFTLHIEQPVDLLMLVMFFIIALLNGILTSRVRRQEKKIRTREERTHALYQLTRDLMQANGMEEVNRIAVRHIDRHFHLKCAILLKAENGRLEECAKNADSLHFSENDRSIANWVYKHSVRAGRNTDTLPSGHYTFYPLAGNSGNMGVIAVVQERSFTQGEEQFWEAGLAQISGKYEREMLREAAKRAFILSESDKLYKTLFNSISHELRIPVTTVMGASETLLSQDFPPETKDNLLREIHLAAVRLNRLIENLLNMSRLESGMISPSPDWCEVRDLANRVEERLSQELGPFRLSVIIPADMPLVRIDFGLTEQAMYNLLLNATQYAPPGSRIRLKMFYDSGSLVIQVMDRGKGFSGRDLEAVFHKFFRGSDAHAGGTGLGLSIVKGFVEAQKGSVMAENRENGGARVTLRIPTEIPGPVEE